ETARRRTARWRSYAHYLQDNTVGTDDAHLRADGDRLGAPCRPVLAGDVDATGADGRVDVVRDDRLPANERLGPRRHAAPAQPPEQTRAQQGDRRGQHDDERGELRWNAVPEKRGRGGGNRAGADERK